MQLCGGSSLSHNTHLGMLQKLHGRYLLHIWAVAVQLVQFGDEAAGVTLVCSKQICHSGSNLCICSRGLRPQEEPTHPQEDPRLCDAWHLVGVARALQSAVPSL